MLDIGANLFFLKTHRGHRIPARPETFPIKVSLSSTKLSRHGDGTLALDIPNHLGHRILWRNPDEHVDMVLHHKQIPRSSRRNPLPMKRINRSLLMGHEHVACALIELMQIRKTPSGAERVFHDAPEAFDGIEVMTTMGR